MVIYPEGNKKVNENKHVSLYLKLSPSNAFTLRRDVIVSFKFFVYNPIYDKYLTIEDRKVRRFRGTKNEWGFDQLLLLNVFNDASNDTLLVTVSYLVLRFLLLSHLLNCLISGGINGVCMFIRMDMQKRKVKACRCTCVWRTVKLLTLEKVCRLILF